jgi:ATP-dependent DNA helicase RecG
VPDGSWSGNVYDFFRLVYRKLTADLKVPFQLHDGQRIEDTPVHEALREALVNTLIHADFSGHASVLVVKRPDMFGFRNPGLMRIPPEQAVRGGTSDCRNRRVQVMFQLVGYGDHAGSGLPKIYRNWAEQHWRRPVLQENTELEQTLIALHMSSLLPAEAVTELETRLGTARCAELSALERLALVTAVAENMVNHTRLKEITTEHPSDLTKTLSALVRRGYLISEGSGRGTVYYPAWHRMDAALTPELAATADDTGSAAGLRVIVDLHMLSPEELDRLRVLAAPVAMRDRATPETLKRTVLTLCDHHCLSLRALAELLGRHPDGVDLRRRILNSLVGSGQLLRIYPNPNDPRQAYRSAPTP